ncbi:MAG: zf-TFIIB domain-containing protein [Gammaproteobacteria bacterium]|nr:zf-TFIIB domain-containing protein [Gammaproteobacteria bacterium]
MNCPKCNSEMEKVVFEHIEVNRCSHCQGIWFDLHEHEILKKIPHSDTIDIGDPNKGKEYNTISKISCPVCKTPMIRMVDNQQPHIWYESCATCYGVFFDAGEFTDLKHHTLVDFIKDLRTKERT